MIEPVELAGFVLSLAMVYCNIKEIHWGWPLAILSSALYGVVFWNTQLYGEASLQVMFILTSFWGWRQWRAGERNAQLSMTETTVAFSISTLMPAELKRVAVTTLLIWPSLSFFLHR
jgi:nicotinamide mononucleotide transporter